MVVSRSLQRQFLRVSRSQLLLLTVVALIGFVISFELGFYVGYKRGYIPPATKVDGASQGMETPRPMPTTREPVFEIQAGAFGDKAEADQLYNLLQRAGYSAQIKQTTMGRMDWFKVSVGPFSDEQLAIETAKLVEKDMGLTTFITKKAP